MNNTTRNWKTSIPGLMALLLAGLSIYSDPKKAADPETIAVITAGIGLLAAKDSDKTGVAEAKPKPQEPPKA